MSYCSKDKFGLIFTSGQHLARLLSHNASSLIREVVVLEDIVAITQKIVDDLLFAHKEDIEAAHVYSIYKKLAKLISDARCVAGGYTVLCMSRSLNTDLKKLNKSTKKFLLKLRYLGYGAGLGKGFLSKYYNDESYFAYVRDEYSVGLISGDCIHCVMEYKVLNTSFEELDSQHIALYGRLNHMTFGDIDAVRFNIRQNCEELEKLLCVIKTFMLQNYKIEDLV